MSYNIDKWKTKKLENLVIPLSAFYLHPRADWHPKPPEITNPQTNEIEMACGCEQTIKGLLIDGHIHVSELGMSGEGSGTFKNRVLDEALKRSKGKLEASLIWGCGDSITRLIVNDGNLEENEVEL
jgi:hypothetical protein